MMSPVFKKTVFISLLSHITAFSIFSLSFGSRLLPADYARVSFWGQVLSNSQVNLPLPLIFKTKAPLGERVDTVGLEKASPKSIAELRYYFKPQVALALEPQKKAFLLLTPPLLLTVKRREPEIILHPLLPYSFPLYFKDRQVAHVELAFNMVSGDGRSSLVLKRKISSGNLEVDLLSIRYISHYLFIRQASLTPNNWQVVKIDLSAKND